MNIECLQNLAALFCFLQFELPESVFALRAARWKKTEIIEEVRIAFSDRGSYGKR